MPNPFLYPKEKISRSQKPPQYKSYRSYKPYLRTEFKGKCVYCQMPDTLIGENQFGADHYRPQKLFPHLVNEYENLFYCCNTCNSYKGEAWLGLVDRFVPNPVDHQMFKHMRFQEGAVVELSKAGEYAIDLLNLNDDETVEYRENVIHTISVLEDDLSELDQAELNARLKFKSAAWTAIQLQEALSKINKIREKTKRSIAQWSGAFS